MHDVYSSDQVFEIHILSGYAAQRLVFFLKLDYFTFSNLALLFYRCDTPTIVEIHIIQSAATPAAADFKPSYERIMKLHSLSIRPQTPTNILHTNCSNKRIPKKKRHI